jgi:DNA replication protein DnaC
MSMLTIGEILARNAPGFDPAALTDPPPADDDGHSAEDLAEMYRSCALRRHEKLTPREFRDARLGPDAPPLVVRWVRAFVEGTLPSKCSIVFSGRVGRGKTHLAYAALRAVAESGCPRSAWAGGTVTEVFARLRPGSGEERATVMHQLSTAPILLLDDLGASKDSEWTEETFLALVDARSRSLAPVIVTTNCDPDELRTQIGDRALSRLIGMSVEIKVDGDDRRIA